ncbi:MAG TPA: bifunctional UDP-N-acetylglucosamine diphosphorylase/glucosamine-1-phosphate N-acetyltransferase GlmU [Clostridia bacterium]|nr:bifunctional UDP-N-acetylglucosamine diphosphorylase/glucosamine-1-phosphate N-acetyltransferase GlmU [Clostridia bacterium]
MENKISAIIMAAGYGPGMKSSLPKAMHKICGEPVVEFVVASVLDVVNIRPLVILGEGSEGIGERLGTRVNYSHLPESAQMGHGAPLIKDYLKDDVGYVILMDGNLPLLTPDTLKDLADSCQGGKYDAVVLSALSDKPQGYSRILRNISGDFEGILEDVKALDEENLIKEIDTSVYCFRVSALLDGLDRFGGKDTDHRHIIGLLNDLKASGGRIGLHTVYDSTETMAVDTRVHLVEAQKIMGQRINSRHLERGVTIIDPDNTYIGPHVTIGRDAIIYPGNFLEGHTAIGEGSILLPNNRILDSVIGKDTRIENSVILESHVGDKTTVGPFAYLRPGSLIEENVRIGDFVEIKNAKVGRGSKVSHLTYVGDGEIGENVNIGCGVVFVNYDGKKKHRTVVGDNAFVGCNTNLVAPVKVEDNSYIAAGSTITQDVPKNALAIARAKQVNKENWVKSEENETEENQ